MSRSELSHRAVLVVDGREVAPVELANTFWRRFRGLMGRRELPAGLLLEPERSVHGMWMFHDLDIALISAEGTVVGVQVLRRWRTSKPVPGTVRILEAPTGNFARWGLGVGSHIETRAG